MPKRLKLLVALLLVVLIAAGVRIWTLPKPGPGRDDYRAGMAAQEQGNLADAQRSLRKALLLEPENGEYHADLGELYLSQANNELALPEFEAAAFLSPERPHVYCKLAQCLVELRRRAEALAALDTALAKAPDCPHALAVRGEQFLRDDNLKDALPAFQKVLSLQPDFLMAYQKVGFILLSTNRVEEAIPVLEQGLKVNPSHPGLHSLLGEAYTRRAGDPQADQQAELHLRQALANNPEAAKAHASLGKLYLRKSMFDAAREEFQQALAQQPFLVEARYGLSQVAARQGKDKEAALHLELYRESQAVQRQLSDLQAQAQAHPRDVGYQVRIARICLERRLYTDAERALTTAVQADPGRRDVRELRARLFVQQGKGSRASSEYAIAAALPAAPVP